MSESQTNSDTKIDQYGNCEEFIVDTKDKVEFIGALMCVASFVFLFFVCLNVQGTLRINEQSRNEYLL